MFHINDRATPVCPQSSHIQFEFTGAVEEEEVRTDLGCWTDTSTRAIPEVEDLGYSELDGDYWERVDSVDKCEDVAKSNGKLYVILQAQTYFYRYSFY